MTIRTVTAMFETRARAEIAGEALVGELHLNRAMIRTNPGTDTTDTDYDNTRPYAEKSFFASLMNLSVSDEDRYAYAEGMRRGNVLLSAQMDERLVDRASDILERAGAINLDEQEATWRKSGWAGYDAAAHSTMRSATSTGVTGTAGVRDGSDETLKVVEERLTIGKRAVEGGRVCGRSYIVEQPVEEQVTLHEERIHVERHPVDRAATAADVAAFLERTIEATARSEEAVVDKEVRVVEEIGITKQAGDRVETVRDTLRRTEVEIVDDTSGTARAPSKMGVGGEPGTPTGRATGGAGAVDKALNTNVSGNSPKADAPDATPGNPPGTMASRAVNGTLGTNIGGVNPERA